jgi:hydrogenase-4 component A
VHLVENRGALGNVLCNCCTCCCAMMRPYLMGADYRPIVAPSRFAVSVDPALCASDEVCVEICPTGAVSAGDGAVQIDQDLCLGCGLCVAHCTGGALSLTAARPPGHIPA